jgi:hypothetical protein
MKLADCVNDATMRLKGAATVLELSRAVPTALAAVRFAIGRVKRIPPRSRRLPEVDQAAGWLWRTIHEIDLGDQQRGELEVAVGELVKLVGSYGPGWRPSPVPRRRAPVKRP